MKPLGHFKVAWLAIFFLLGYVCIPATAQDFVKETAQADIVFGASSTLVVPKSTTATPAPFAMQAVSINIQLDMLKNSNEYIYGTSDGSYPFDFKATFILKALDASSNEIPGVFDKSIYTLSITNEKNLAVFTKDLSALIDAAKIKLPFESVEVVNPTLTVNNGGAITTSIRCTASLKVDYAYGVASGANLLPPATTSPVVINGKTAEFTWDCPFPYTLYQLQLLRLYNNDTLLKTETKISADIDWTKAITIDVAETRILDEYKNLITSHSTSYTVGEGTGFYVWRIRPVGNYYQGGVANSMNWGAWSYTVEGAKELNTTGLETAYYFFYTDPDEDKNLSFNRVFTEENKVKEVTTYANGLNQVKQVKTYLPSNNVTLTAQTIQDYNARPGITTLPMPTKGKIEGYSESYVTKGNKLYTTLNFDGDTKTQADPMDEQRQMHYYNNNPDPRIPDAQGIPFAQTKYYDDPLNRPKEEGGPGQTHMIKGDGSGKTIRYMYGTPSQTELIRIFGKEAPDHQTVSKAVKIDQNNIATITYTSLEGKIIATSLAFYESDDLSSLDPITTNSSFTADDKITQNLKTDWGFLSSKRVMLMASTTLNIVYSVKESTLNAGCLKVTIDCHYLLDIIIRNIENGTITYAAQNQSLSGINPDADGNIVYAAPAVQLQAGTYVIEKRLRPGDSEANITKARKDMQGQIYPLTNLIESTLAEVKCKAMTPDYYQFVKGMTDALDNKTLEAFLNTAYKGKIPDSLKLFIDSVYNNKFPADPTKFGKDYYRMKLYKFNTVTNKYDSIPASTSENPELAQLFTPCCVINVPVKWTRKFDSNVVPKIGDIDNDGIIEAVNVDDVENGIASYEIMPDFEGYAMAYFSSCPELNNFQFYKYMEGWNYKPNGKDVQTGAFNLMVYHMITDNLYPYTLNPFIEEEKKLNGKIGGQVIEPASTSNVVVPVASGILDNKVCDIVNYPGNKVYTIAKLFKCWETELQMLRSQMGCGEESYNNGLDGPTNVMGNASKEQDGTKLDNHFDNGFDDIKMSKRRKRKIKKKVSKAMRELNVNNNLNKGNASELHVNIVKDFLDCTGYTFVKVITPYNPKPLAEDAIESTSYQYNVYTPADKPYKYRLDNSNVSIADYFASGSVFRKTNGDMYYYPLKDWDPKIKDNLGNIVQDSLFTNIKNPIYAFKYFEYENEGKQSHQAFEFSNCYDDPNDCYQLDAQGNIDIDPVTGGFIKIPCCVSTSGDDGFCYKDQNYPHIDAIYKAGDPRFGQTADGKNYKLIVKDFTDWGRTKCPYDHFAWNAEQRYAFYGAISKYIVKPLEVVSSGRTCADLEKPNKWLLNNDENNDLPLYITDEERVKNGIQNTEPYTDFHRLDGDNNNNRFIVSWVEMEMAGIIYQCNSQCESRRGDFDAKLREMLLANCYDIDGCKPNNSPDPPYGKVISNKDIDIIVDTLVSKCKSQCNVLSTFGCVETASRDMNTAKVTLGPTTSYQKLMYGMGGFPKDNYYDCEHRIIPKYDDAKYYDPTFDGTVGKLKDRIQKCRLTDTIPEDRYSWYQYTLVDQAANWDFDLNLPSKCPSFKIEAENTSETNNVRVTLNWVENFGPGSWIKFPQVNFGPATEKIKLHIAVPGADAGKQIILRTSDPASGNIIGTLTTSSTGSGTIFSEQDVVLSNPVSGIADLYLVGSGGGTNIATIDYILLSSKQPYSNIQEFTGCDGGSTFVEKSKYETEAGSVPYDKNNEKIADPVKSPATQVIIQVKDN